MRKHFLILMLMTLLPLAGWATDYEVKVTTFNGTATWTGKKPVVQPGWFTAELVGAGAPSAAQKELIATALQVKDLTTNPNYNVGAWDYQLELRGSNTVSDDVNNYTIFVNSSTTATLTITKFTGAPEIEPNQLAYVEDFAYTGSAKSLLTLTDADGAKAATATVNGVAAPVVYALSADAETWVGDYTAITGTDAGTYTVYYKVAGTDNYTGSATATALVGEMKILQKDLTDDFTVADAKPTPNTWEYDAQAHDLFIAPVDPIKFGTTEIPYEYSLTGEDATWYTSAQIAASEDLTAAFKGTSNTGNKNVYWRVAATANYTGSTGTLTATITKATPTFTTLPTFAEGKVYDDSPLKLIKSAGVATLGAQPKYRIKAKKANGTWGSASVWKFGFENDLFTKTNAGVYKIEYTTDPTDDLNAATSGTYFESDEITIAKADITGFTDPVAKTGLRVKGANEAQDLVTKASWGENTELGTFQYKVGEGDWSADAKGTTAGTYSVNFQIVPTDAVNYNTYTIAEPLSVTIAAKTTVTIAAKANQTFGYGTTPVIEYDVTWTDKREDDLNVENLTWGWYTNSDCSTPAEYVTGTTYYAVGDYYVKATGAAVTGTTAASQEIVYTPVAVKITAGQVTAKISGTATYGNLPTFTLTHVSGLSPAEAENFNADNNLTKVTIKQNGEVVNNLENVAPDNAGLAALAKGEYDLEATASCGTNYAVVVTGEKLTVGAKSIAGAVINVTTDADAIVYNNKAWGTVNPIAFEVTETSGIEAADYDVAYSNNVNAGTATITLTGKRNYTGTVTKDFTIKKAALTIKADDTTWTYGTTEPTYAVTVEGQAEGETALKVGGNLAGIDGALTVVRTSNETVGAHAGALVAKFGSDQPNASSNYNIIYVPGNLQVAKSAITIKLKNNVITGTYGNAPSAAITAAILTDKANYELDNSVENNVLPDGNLADILDVSGVTFEIDPIANNKYEVNQEGYAFTMTGATTTNYAVTISNGTYKVNPADITLYAKNQTINWADEDNTNDKANTTVSDATVEIAAGALKCGDALTAVVASIVIESQKVGTNNISLTAADNANYNITVNSDGTHTKYGVLTVTGAPALALSTADADLADKLASYNGKSMPVTIDFSARARTLGTKAREWQANTWVTMTLPFDISVADLSEALGYAIVNVIDPSRTEISGTGSKFYGKLTMKGGNGYVDPVDAKKNDTKLAANKPFMVKTADAITGVINFGDQTIVAPADLSVNAGSGATFTGTYKIKKVDYTSDAKIWFLLGNNDQWAYIPSTVDPSIAWNIVPFEGFIDMTGASASAPNMTFYFEELDGTTTAVKSINADSLNGKMDAEGWYNLNGMKMQSAPTQKGVYIKDGKKVVIK